MITLGVFVLGSLLETGRWCTDLATRTGTA
jgi:hypothetical protein